MSLRVQKQVVHIGICVTENIPNARIVLRAGDREIASSAQTISVAEPFTQQIALPNDVTEQALALRLFAGEEQVLHYAPGEVVPAPSPQVATEPPAPEEIAGNDELYLTGLHLQQYRHATRLPEPYWQEALRRDAGDARCNTALGAWRLRRGEFAAAEKHLRTAIERLTLRNANPKDGETYYQLGLVLRYQQRFEEAYAVFYKSTWNSAWRAPAFYALATIDARKQQWAAVLAHTEKSLQAESGHLQARCLRIVALRNTGNTAEAERLLTETLQCDGLYGWANFLRDGSAPVIAQDRIDLAFDLMRCGLWSDARALLQAPYQPAGNDGSQPILLYALAAVQRALGDDAAAEATSRRAASVSPDYCFPSRLDEMQLLQEELHIHPHDHRAAFYLGHMFYDMQRYDDAIRSWEQCPQDDACYSIAQRNLGIAYFNVRHNEAAALKAYDNAFAANPTSARLLYERDQLWKRTGVSAAKRLAEFESHRALIAQRDDLSVELATLYNQLAQPERALTVLQRNFQPWEGGEGLVLAQYVRAHVLVAQKQLASGDAKAAVQSLQAALNPPHHLGETFHLLANRSEIFYHLGLAYRAANDEARANEFLTLAARKQDDFQNMSVATVSSNTYWTAMALRELGRQKEAEELFARIELHAREMHATPAKIDYFATSLPTLLLFHEDLEQRKNQQADLLLAQAWIGMRQEGRAIQQLQTLLKADPNQMDALGLLQSQSVLAVKTDA